MMVSIEFVNAFGTSLTGAGVISIACLRQAAARGTSVPHRSTTHARGPGIRADSQYSPRKRVSSDTKPHKAGVRTWRSGIHGNFDVRWLAGAGLRS
jgi:hypothetical protein